jgi:hypothetical protein
MATVQSKGENAGACRFIQTCPAATGWCMISVPDVECLEMVINQYAYLKDTIRESFQQVLDTL